MDEITEYNEINHKHTNEVFLYEWRNKFHPEWLFISLNVLYYLEEKHMRFSTSNDQLN